MPFSLTSTHHTFVSILHIRIPYTYNSCTILLGLTPLTTAYQVKYSDYEALIIFVINGCGATTKY